MRDLVEVDGIKYREVFVHSEGYGIDLCTQCDYRSNKGFEAGQCEEPLCHESMHTVLKVIA